MPTKESKLVLPKAYFVDVIDEILSSLGASDLECTRTGIADKLKADYVQKRLASLDIQKIAEESIEEIRLCAVAADLLSKLNNNKHWIIDRKILETVSTIATVVLHPSDWSDLALRWKESTSLYLIKSRLLSGQGFTDDQGKMLIKWFESKKSIFNLKSLNQVKTANWLKDTNFSGIQSRLKNLDKLDSTLPNTYHALCSETHFSREASVLRDAKDQRLSEIRDYHILFTISSMYPVVLAISQPKYQTDLAKRYLAVRLLIFRTAASEPHDEAFHLLKNTRIPSLLRKYHSKQVRLEDIVQKTLEQMQNAIPDPFPSLKSTID